LICRGRCTEATGRRGTELARLFHVERLIVRGAAAVARA
jgi:hypothetical protein